MMTHAFQGLLANLHTLCSQRVSRGDEIICQGFDDIGSMFFTYDHSTDVNVLTGFGKVVSRHEPSFALDGVLKIEFIEPNEVVVIPGGRGKRKCHEGQGAMRVIQLAAQYKQPTALEEVR